MYTCAAPTYEKKYDKINKNMEENKQNGTTTTTLEREKLENEANKKTGRRFGKANWKIKTN